MYFSYNQFLGWKLWSSPAVLESTGFTCPKGDSMDTRHLQNNQELFDYLVSLSVDLDAKGEYRLAEEVKRVSRFVNGSPSEFLHESQVVLRMLSSQYSSLFSSNELNDLASVVEQIELAFKSIGGA